MTEQAAAAPPGREAFLGLTGSRRQVGILGIALGAVAAWLALPPVLTRSWIWPLLVGLVAVGCGVWALLGEERRVGWGAIASGVVGVTAALFAQQSGVSALEGVFVWGALVGATLRFATPLAFAAIGGIFSERSGVVNIALEGMMLAGAFFGIWGADKTGSWVLGLLIAMVAGGTLALIHAYFAIHLRADQIVGGTAINFLALGITGYLFIDIYGQGGTPTLVPAEEIPDVSWPGRLLEHLPDGRITNFLIDAIGSLNLMIWVVLILLVVSYLVLFRTPIGLRIRAVGEHPRAADTVGISVYGVRYGAVTLSGMLAALGGAYLSIGFVHSFNENMTSGRGFIALAAVVFGNWRPFAAFGATCLFGFSSAVADRLGPAYGTQYDTLFEALPYALTLIAVAGVIGRSIPPAAVGRPYKKQ